MFKGKEQVFTFIDLLERFTKAVINSRNSSNIEDAVVLNKARDGLEAFVIDTCGIAAERDTTDVMVCPDCASDMALRANRQTGNKFWGCKKYPNCKGTRDENGLSRQDREEQKYKKEQAAQEGGFSFNREKGNSATEVALSTDAIPTWVNPFVKE